MPPIFPHSETPGNATSLPWGGFFLFFLQDVHLLLWRIRQPLDDHLSPCNTDNRHTRHLPHPPLQIPIIGAHNIDLALHNTVNDAVICVSSFVIAGKAFPAFIAGYSERDAVLWAEFFELGHYCSWLDEDMARAREEKPTAGCDDWDAFCVERIHQRLQKREFSLYTMRQEVGVYQDTVWRNQCRVVLEEKGGGDLWSGERALAEELKEPTQTYTSRTISAPLSFFFDSSSPLSWFFFSRASFWPINRLTWWGCELGGQKEVGKDHTAPNLRVFFETPMLDTGF
jgi:hypothetical protein